MSPSFTHTRSRQLYALHSKHCRSSIARLTGATELGQCATSSVVWWQRVRVDRKYRAIPQRGGGAGNRKRQRGCRRLSHKHWLIVGFPAGKSSTYATDPSGKKGNGGWEKEGSRMLSGSDLKCGANTGGSPAGWKQKVGLCCSFHPKLCRLSYLPIYLLPVVVPFLPRTLGDFSTSRWSPLENPHEMQ